MKQTFLFLIAVCISALAVQSCKKDKKEQLPPETQTGARTFGCLINGEVFIPGGAQLSGGSLNCNYQEIDGDYYFRLVGSNYQDKGKKTDIGINLHKIKYLENKKYLLEVAFKDSSGSGLYIGPELNICRTDSIRQGELFIKYLDTARQIVSGTFWFDAVGEDGGVVQVRQGRFDMRYTR